MTTTYIETLVAETCCHASCGVTFGMTEAFRRLRINDHAWFYCPNGHQQHFTGRTEEEKLRARLRTSQESERFYQQQAALERRRTAAQKGQRTRVLNLIAKGICPVAGCRRNFDNVRSHMATEHPDFHEHGAES